MIQKAIKQFTWMLNGGYKPKEFWDNWAETFINDPWQRQIHPQHRWLLRVIKTKMPSRILEVGCGFGRNIKYLIEHNVDPRSITGIDISNKMIRLARRYINEDKVTLLASDINAFNSRKKFDLVFTHGVLMHVPKYKAESVLEKIISLSKGNVVLIEQNYEADNEYTFIHDYKSLLKKRKLDIIKYHGSIELGLDLIYVKVR